MRRAFLCSCFVACASLAHAQPIVLEANDAHAQVSLELVALDDDQLGLRLDHDGETVTLELAGRVRDGIALLEAQWLDSPDDVVRIIVGEPVSNRALVAAVSIDGDRSRVLIERRTDLDRQFEIVARDLDGDGTNEIVAQTLSMAAQICGHPDVAIEPRAYDADSGTFRPIGIRFDFEVATTLRPEGAAPSSRFEAAPLVAVSSDESAPLAELWQPAPASLVDGDAQTAWRDGWHGDGRGQFVSARVLEGALLAGVELVAVGDGARRWLLTTTEGDFALEAAGPGPHYFELPQPVESWCFSVVAIDTAEDDCFALAELRAVSQLDLVDLDELFVGPLGESLESAEGVEAVGALLAAANLDVAPFVIAALDSAASADHRVALLEVLVEIDGGVDALVDALAHDGLSDDAVVLATRTLARRGGVEDALVELALGDSRAAPAALAALASLGHLDRADRLARLAGRGDAIERDLLINVLSSMTIEELDVALASHATLDEDARIDLLRTAMRIVSREAVALPASCEAFDLAAHSTQGSEARLGLAAGVAAGCDATTAYAVDVLGADPEPMMRAAAASALGQAGTHLGRVVEAVAIDESPDVRIEAARALRDAPLDDIAMATLGEALATETWPEIRRHIARALIAQNDPVADAAVFSRIAIADESETRTLLRVFGNRVADVDSIGLLEAIDTLPREQATLVAVAALLARAAGSAASDRLASWCINDADELRDAACEAAARRGLAGVRDYIENRARNGVLDERLAAFRALAAYGDAESRETLRELLEGEPDESARAALERLLSRSHSIEALDDLRDRIAPSPPTDLEL